MGSPVKVTPKSAAKSSKTSAKVAKTVATPKPIRSKSLSPKKTPKVAAKKSVSESPKKTPKSAKRAASPKKTPKSVAKTPGLNRTAFDFSAVQTPNIPLEMFVSPLSKSTRRATVAAGTPKSAKKASPAARKKLSVGTPNFEGISAMMKTPAAAKSSPRKSPAKKAATPKKTPKAVKSPMKTPLKVLARTGVLETPNLEGIAE